MCPKPLGDTPILNCVHEHPTTDTEAHIHLYSAPRSSLATAPSCWGMAIRAGLGTGGRIRTYLSRDYKSRAETILASPVSRFFISLFRLYKYYIIFLENFQIFISVEFSRCDGTHLAAVGKFYQFWKFLPGPPSTYDYTSSTTQLQNPVYAVQASMAIIPSSIKGSNDFSQSTRFFCGNSLRSWWM